MFACFLVSVFFWILGFSGFLGVTVVASGVLRGLNIPFYAILANLL